MSLFQNPRTLLSEAASADLLAPEVSEEVKEVIDNLEDTLTNNVEEVKDEDKTTNGGIPVVAEGVSIMKSNVGYGRAEYLVKLEDVIAVMETEGEEAAKAAMEEPGTPPSEEDIEKHEPNAVNVVEDIAEKNGVDPEQVAVVISAEAASFLAETALLEAKNCKKKGKGTKRIKKTAKAVDQLKGKVKLVKA